MFAVGQDGLPRSLVSALEDAAEAEVREVEVSRVAGYQEVANLSRAVTNNQGRESGSISNETWRHPQHPQ